MLSELDEMSDFVKSSKADIDKHLLRLRAFQKVKADRNLNATDDHILGEFERAFRDAAKIVVNDDSMMDSSSSSSSDYSRSSR